MDLPGVRRPRRHSTRRPVVVAAATTTAAALLAACALSSGAGAADATDSSSTPEVARPAAADDEAARSADGGDDAVNFVVAISVDGLKSSTIRQLGRDGLPFLHRIKRNGASTLNARNLVERTVTLPNHTSMVTGRRVDSSEGGHGVNFNNDQGTTVHQHANEYVDSMFDVAHNRGLRTSMYVSKDKFHTLDRSWDEVHGAGDAVGTDEGRDKIDRYFLDDESDNVRRLVRRLRNRPDHISFLHLAYPDAAGHQHGWGSPEYLDAVKAADRQLGRIVTTIRDSRRLRRHVNVVLTSDHGGIGYGHSDASVRANYKVPFIVWGVGVAKGNLYRLNETTRLNPGKGRPDYSGTQPVRNGEMGNLVLDLLDLPGVPGSLFNSERDLAVR